jgi:hypothetical protein
MQRHEQRTKNKNNLQEKEKDCIQLAKKKQREEERKEFDNLKEDFESGNVEFSDFKAFLARMWEPFSCEVWGENILVSPDSAAAMFDKAALGAMNKALANGGGNPDKKGLQRRSCDKTLLLRTRVSVLAVTKRAAKRTMGTMRLKANGNETWERKMHW